MDTSNGLGGLYMDQNVNKSQPMNGAGYPPSNLGMAFANRDMGTMEAQERAKMLALLFKQYYPDMPDNVIGQHVRRMLLTGDLNEAAFGNALSNSQKQLGMTY